jgi:lysophospholipase L1-like esterase
MVIWITPPDSAKFPDWVEQEVARLITANNRKHRYGTIRSETRYIMGETGADGVHYNEKGADLWVAPIIQKIDRTFTRYGVK